MSEEAAATPPEEAAARVPAGGSTTPSPPVGENTGGKPADTAKAPSPPRYRDALRTVSIEAIDPPTLDLRVSRDPETIRALAADIERDALLQLPGARMLPGGRYRIVYGYTRFLALRQLGRKKITIALVDCTNETDEIMAGLRENLARTELSDADLARASDALRQRGKSGKEVAALLAIDQTRVSRLRKTWRHPVLGPAALAGRITWEEAAAMAKVPPTALAALIEDVATRRAAGAPMKLVAELRPLVRRLRAGGTQGVPRAAERLKRIRGDFEGFVREHGGRGLDPTAIAELDLLGHIVAGEAARYRRSGPQG